MSNAAAAAATPLHGIIPYQLYQLESLDYGYTQ